MMLDPSQGIALFTDGSAYTKDRSGGWAWLAVDIHGATESGSGPVADTTISRMELQAPTEGLTLLHRVYGSINVLVYSDSQYVVLGCSDVSRKRRVNKDCWKLLDIAIALHEYVEFNHVKGHSTNEWNKKVDALAGAARRTL